MYRYSSHFTDKASWDQSLKYLPKTQKKEIIMSGLKPTRLMAGVILPAVMPAGVKYRGHLQGTLGGQYKREVKGPVWASKQVRPIDPQQRWR